MTTMFIGKLVREHMPFVETGLHFIVQAGFKLTLGDHIASVHRCWDYKYRSLGLARTVSVWEAYVSLHFMLYIFKISS